jgi:AcrR family transcriptional regulator
MSGRREEILDAAVALADERGLAAVSMRAVADRVGVTPMALYPHVGGKAALLDGMVGRLLSAAMREVVADAAAGSVPAASSPAGDWRARLTLFARAGREMTRRHPWSATLMFSRPSVTPDAVRVVDELYAALLAAGVPADQVPRVERLVSTFLLGYAASVAGGRFGPVEDDPRGRRGRLPDGELPAHARLSAVLARPVDWDAEFDADLADLGRLIEALATGPR